MTTTTSDADVARVARIEVVPLILEVVCRTTGLGFSAVARVTDARWIACAVRDEIAFGLEPGGELVVATTICDEIRQHGRVVAFDDATRDEVFRSHPTPRMYGFRSYISVPIVREDGSFFGTLCGIDPRPLSVSTPSTVGMFTLFAQLIGMHLDAEDRVSDLEARVAERTADLRSLTARFERVREDERIRIARELHDELGQGLTAIKLEIGLAEHTLRRASRDMPDRMREALASMAIVTDRTLDAAERIISELRPAVLDALGLAAAIEWLVAEFQKRTGITALITCVVDSRMASDVETALFRVLQEALTNVIKHAHASQVSVTLQRDAGFVCLVVTDDGCGVSGGGITAPHAFGLRGMRERMESLGGSLSLTAGVRGGTSIAVRCPTCPTLA